MQFQFSMVQPLCPIILTFCLQIPRGEPASVCFKTALVYIEQNSLKEAMLCLDEAFLGLAKELSLGTDIKPQARIIAQYKIAVRILQVTNSSTILDCGML